jgi:Protein of unknown function (DUF3052)
MAGYSGTPLFKKLGYKDGFTAKAVNAPAHYMALLGDAAAVVTFTDRATTNIDLIHLFTNSQKELATALPRLMKQIRKDGTIWVSWYKKSSGKATEVTEDMVRNTALASGLVDVKVCAVDEDWSGLKLVYRLKDR